MKLLTKEIIATLPALYAQEGKGDDAIAYVKFFDPCGFWTWYATEGSLVCPDHGMCDCEECPKENWKDFLFFGLVEGVVDELGYFTLDALESIKGPLGLGIERDLGWQPRPLTECRKVTV